MKALILSWMLIILFGTSVRAHHGVASLGVAGLEGPGSPIETSSSTTLPEGASLFYTKLDFADFATFSSARDNEGNYNAFWMNGAGYGLKSYLSFYLFVPFYSKTVEDNSYNTTGFADISIMAVLGFKYDQGFLLSPANESLDDLMDWHFTSYAGLTIPTGDPNIRDVHGTIDPGMSLGFGRPSFTFGLTATKQISNRLTWIGDTSYITFSEYEYDDRNKTQFGDELRLNIALSIRLLVDQEAKSRLDGVIESNFLNLGRDATNGIEETATGGNIFYLVPGFRWYYKNFSFAAGVKLPELTDLNEEDLQQGAEGKENYRAIFTFSILL